MSVIWPHLYQHRPGRKLAVNLSSTEIEIAEISRFLCHRYFSRKMRRSGLPLRSGSLAHVKSFSHRTDEHTTLEICQMIETMEQLYPDIFNSVTTNMHVSSFHERQLCQDFSRFAEALFKNGIKWSLLLAYFAFCGGLAEECMRNGKPRLVTSVMNWSHCFISMHLVVWIEEQGGWVSLQKWKKVLHTSHWKNIVCSTSGKWGFFPKTGTFHLPADIRHIKEAVFT